MPIEGQIGQHGLAEWWLSTFTEDERQLMEERYGSDLTRGRVRSSPTQRDIYRFLYQLAGWFKRKDQTPLALRLLNKAQEYRGPATDEHFYLSTYIEVRYKQRDDDPEALQDVVAACQRMIEIAPLVHQDMRQEHDAQEAHMAEIYQRMGDRFKPQRFGLPPRHKGFEQLIIIRKKQKDKAEAERLVKEYKRVWGRYSLDR